MLTTKWLYS